MLSKIKLWFFNHKNYLRMSRFLIVTVALLLVTWIFDHQYIAIKSYIPKQLLLSVEVSVDFLSNLSGIFLTISTFSFTIIVTVLNKYSSNISPRMLQSFIDRTGVLGLYGIFVSGFFYSVISILLLQDIAPDQHVVAGSFGIAYSIIAMLSFIAFSRQVLDNLQVSNIIENVFNDCEKLIDKEVELRKKAKHYEEGYESTNLSIVAESSGYLFQCKLDDNDKKELKEKLSPLFIINAYNNREEDYHRGIVNLTEIANMALSPGTNDPNTAIMCINKMSSLLGKLLSTGNHFIILKEDEDVKIIYQSYSVKDELYLGFSQIISYSAGDPLVTKEILQGIYIIYIMADMGAKKSIKRFFDDSYDILMENFTHEIHLDIFNKIKNNMEEHVSL